MIPLEDFLQLQKETRHGRRIPRNRDELSNLISGDSKAVEALFKRAMQHLLQHSDAATADQLAYCRAWKRHLRGVDDDGKRTGGAQAFFPGGKFPAFADPIDGPFSRERGDDLYRQAFNHVLRELKRIRQAPRPAQMSSPPADPAAETTPAPQPVKQTVEPYVLRGGRTPSVPEEENPFERLPKPQKPPGGWKGSPAWAMDRKSKKPPPMPDSDSDYEDDL